MREKRVIDSVREKKIQRESERRIVRDRMRVRQRERGTGCIVEYSLIVAG